MYLCSSGKVETEKHFILECEALKDNRENYAGILVASSWDNLFSKEFVEKLGAIIVKLHRKRAEYKSQIEKPGLEFDGLQPSFVPQPVFDTWFKKSNFIIDWHSNYLPVNLTCDRLQYPSKTLMGI
jgi:hypothetical protein